MNITSVNQQVPVQKTREDEIWGTQTADITGKNAEVKKSQDFAQAKQAASAICRTVVETEAGLVGLMETEEEDAGSQESLENTANRMTEEDYKDLEEEGYSLEAYEAGRLERALERRKANMEFREETTDAQIEKKEELREDIEKIAINNRFSDPMAKKAAQKLAESNLPITEENVTAILNALNFAEVLPQISESGIAAIIDKEAPLTLEQIYQNQYSSVKAPPKAEEVWKAVEEQAKELLRSEGIEASGENMGKARWLFDNDLPITATSFDTYDSLVQLRQGIDEDTLIGKMAEAMKRGLKPEQADLNLAMTGKIEQAVKDFDAVTEEAVTKAAEEGEKINLIRLRDAQHNLEQEDASSKAAAQKVVSAIAAEKSPAAVTAYRQLEEIRLKLTLESAHTLAGKGIRIDTSELQKIVEGLKEIENQYYQNLLEEAGAEKTEENFSLLKETTETVASVKVMPAAVLGATLEQNVGQNISELHQAGSQLKAAYDQAEEKYETLMTAPRKDMGDSIEKAFQSVDAILKDLDMEATADNQRAVRILGYNRMEITEESVTAVKAYDSQVNNLLNELHPAATVELIKRGINPLNMPMEQLIDTVKNIKEELGVTEEEKYSTYLWKLEKQNGISEQERKSYIGFYRLLSNVEKTNGAAIGSVLDTGKELTMGNLLTAVRTMKNGGINAKIDDYFGALESISFSRETITEQIEAGLGAGRNQEEAQSEFRQNQMAYESNVLEQVLDKVSPDKLAQIAGGNPEKLMDLTLAQLKDELEAADGDKEIQKEYYREMMENLRAGIAEGSEPAAFLERFSQPVSLANLEVVSEYFTGGKNVFKELQKKADNLTEDQKAAVAETLESLSDSIEDKEGLQQKYEELEEKAQEILNREYENTAITSGELRNLGLFGKAIALAGSMSRNEHYEIPIITGDTITNISLTIQKGGREKGKLQITMESEKLGRVEVEAAIKKQVINGVILCETTEGLETLKNCQEQMTEGLEKLGLEVKQLSAAVSQRALEGLKSREDGTEEKTDTKVLYRAAKVFVESLKTVQA